MYTSYKWFKIKLSTLLINQIQHIVFFITLSLPAHVFATPLLAFIEFGGHSGGDSLPNEEMAGPREDEVKAGGLVSFGAGLYVPVSESIELIPFLGLKRDYSLIRNAFFDGKDHATWSVTVLNMSVAYKTENFKYSVGVTHHKSPELVSKGETETTTWKFNDATGSIYQIDYILNDNSTLGLRYEKITYDATGFHPVNGDNFGLILRIGLDI
ncbi:MAG: hypothetical protein OEY52_00310 [Gammaproteobacteria bacterium]|nr:hypothetical protein [Gammaproteobacteria bacterium]